MTLQFEESELMHMADALISPAVGGAMWAATAVTTVYCAKKVREDLDQAKIPLMGVMGAFIFAAQMLNFTIPGTGSSGHLGGGLILAILLGPEAAFLVMASVLAVQALFFADGGLLSLGANIFNLGFFPAFVAFPLVYRRIVGPKPRQARIVIGSMLAALVGLELGTLGVVLETTFSGISSLPFATFVAMVMPIHVAIALVEGVVTAAVVTFVWRAEPQLLAYDGGGAPSPPSRKRVRAVLIAFAVAALLLGGVFSWFASTNPDGLEWSIARVTGSTEIKGRNDVVHRTLAAVQRATAFFPDYAPRRAEGLPTPAPGPVDAGASVAGVVGALATLAIAGLIGAALFLRRARRPGSPRAPGRHSAPGR